MGRVNRLIFIEENNLRGISIFVIGALISVIFILVISFHFFFTQEQSMVVQTINGAIAKNAGEAFIEILLPHLFQKMRLLKSEVEKDVLKCGKLKKVNNELFDKFYLNIVKPWDEFEDYTLEIDALDYIKNNKVFSKLVKDIFHPFSGLTHFEKVKITVRVLKKDFEKLDSHILKGLANKRGYLRVSCTVKYKDTTYTVTQFKQIVVINTIPELLGKFSLIVRQAFRDRMGRYDKDLYNLCEISENGEILESGYKPLIIYNNPGTKELRLRSQSIKKVVEILRDIIMKKSGWIFLGEYEGYLNAKYGKDYADSFSEEFMFYLNNPVKISKERIIEDITFPSSRVKFVRWEQGVLNPINTGLFPIFKYLWYKNRKNFKGSILSLYGRQGRVTPTLVIGKVYVGGLRVCALVDRAKKGLRSVLTSLPALSAVSSNYIYFSPKRHVYEILPYFDNERQFRRYVRGDNYLLKFVCGPWITKLRSSDPAYKRSIYYKDIPKLESFKGESVYTYQKYMSNWFKRPFNLSLAYIATFNENPFPEYKIVSPNYLKPKLKDSAFLLPKEFRKYLKNPENYNMNLILNRINFASFFKVPHYYFKCNTSEEFINKLKETGMLFRNLNGKLALALNGVVKTNVTIKLPSVELERGGVLITRRNIIIEGALMKNKLHPYENLILCSVNQDIIINSGNKIFACLIAPKGTVKFRTSTEVHGNIVVNYLDPEFIGKNYCKLVYNTQSLSQLPDDEYKLGYIVSISPD